MPKLLLVCATSAFFYWVPGSQAALLSYEGFNYTAGTSIVGQNGGTGFSQAWQLNSSGGIFTNQANSLSYRDAAGNTLLTTGGSLFLQGSLTNGVGTASGPAAQPNRTLSYIRGTNSGGADGVTTWVSFLAVRQGITTNNPTYPDNPYLRAANLALYNSSPNKEKLSLGNTALNPSNVVTLLPLGDLANARPSSVPFDQTNLIVVRIDHIASAFDNAYLFVNPPLGSEPDVALADTDSIGQFDFSINRLRPFAGGRKDLTSEPYAEIVMDEIRIGETFADVAPFLPSLQIARSGNNVVLTWSGTNQLQSSENVVGTYTNLTGATSPYTNSISNTSLFFRLFN